MSFNGIQMLVSMTSISLSEVEITQLILINDHAFTIRNKFKEHVSNERNIEN